MRTKQYITPRLDYCNALLYGVNTNIISKIQRVQNTATRLITRSKKQDHITPVLMSLHWLPVQFRIQYKLLLYTSKALHGQGPIYLKELVSFYQPSRLLWSENVMMIQYPRSRTKTYGFVSLFLLTIGLLYMYSMFSFVVQFNLFYHRKFLE